MDSKQMQMLNDVYKKWENKSAGGSFAGSTSNGNAGQGREAWVRRFGNDLNPPNRRAPAKSKRRQRTRQRDEYEPVMPMTIERKFHVPNAVIPAAFIRDRPFMGKGCGTCCPETEQLFYTEKIPNRGMHNILNIAVYIKKNLFKRTFCHVDFIMTRDVSHNFPDLKTSVLSSDRVKNCILNTVYQDGSHNVNTAKDADLFKLEKSRQKQVSKLSKQAKGIMDKIAAAIYRNLIRFTGWFLFKLFGRLLNSIQIHRGQVHMVKQAAEENKPIIFLPLHKSHLDYILVTYVLLTCDVKSPHVAAGDNLSHMFLFSWLMRHLGGFFIKRKLDHESGKDDLYKSVLQEYVQQLLENEQYLEIFIEGSRSRTGKAMVPKSGLLSVVVNAVLEDIVNDVLIVPVNISYEKLFETSYSHELLGEPKRPETFLEAVKGIWEVFGARYGNIRVDFSRPFSLKEFSQSLDCSPIMQSFGTTMVSRSSVTSTPASSMLRNSSDLSLSDYGEEQCFMLTKVLGYHVVYDAVQCSAVMSTNMVAFIFLYIHRQGATIDDLMIAFDELTKQVVGRGRDVGFSGETSDVLYHALDLLKDLFEVQQHENETLIKPCLGIPQVIDLLHYSNLVLCVFATESVLACSICAVAKERDVEITDIEQEQTLPQNLIIEKAKELCELLQKEFIFTPPCVALETRLVESLETFISSEIIVSTDQGTSSNKRDWTHRFSVSTWDDGDYDNDEGDDVYDTYCPEYKLTTSKTELLRLLSLQSLIGPLIESYWVATCGLLWLQRQDFTESDFLKAIHDCSKERVTQNLTMYPESCSLEPYRNAIRIFKETMVVELQTSEEGHSLLRLTDKYNNEESLFELISNISQFKL